MEKFDYVIIGQGSAAFSAAIKANELGKNTLMIGKNATAGAVLGGTCINVGCVPSKRMISVARFFKELSLKRFGGINYDLGSLEYERVVEEKDELLKTLHKSKYEDVIGSMENVHYLNEFGSFTSRTSIKAGKKEIEADRVLIATGARAFIPKIEGLEKIDYLDHEKALAFKGLPRSIIVVGGRAVGLEFAQMFSMFGSKVTVLQRSPTILPNWEPVIAKRLEKYLIEDGIDVITNAAPKKFYKSEGKIMVDVELDGNVKTFSAEKLLMATGRAPDTDMLDLEKASVETYGNGFVKIDNTMRTGSTGIFAAGDVTGSPMLETLAAKEGNLATQNAFGGGKLKININEVPSAVFTEPEAAMVGKTEEQVISDLKNCGCNVLPAYAIAEGQHNIRYERVDKSRDKSRIPRDTWGPHACSWSSGSDT
jgi:Pyruvate/2-oxoglutarate dehydrogenase complex, dihydrolipoamide dehydrogenase (E3) component, and related enzymes